VRPWLPHRLFIPYHNFYLKLSVKKSFAQIIKFVQKKPIYCANSMTGKTLYKSTTIGYIRERKMRKVLALGSICAVVILVFATFQHLFIFPHKTQALVISLGSGT
jgi:hypothetical protein